jgi:hypothetical protein
VIEVMLPVKVVPPVILNVAVFVAGEPGKAEHAGKADADKAESEGRMIVTVVAGAFGATTTSVNFVPEVVIVYDPQAALIANSEGMLVPE